MDETLMRKLLAIFTLFSCPLFGQVMQQGIMRSAPPIIFGTINADAVYEGNFSTPGTAMTASIGNSSMSSTFTPTWAAPPASTFSVGANQSICDNLGPIQVNGGGPTFATGALAYNSVAHDDSQTQTYWNLNATYGYAVSGDMTTGVCWVDNQAPFPGTGQGITPLSIFSDNGHYSAPVVSYEIAGVLSVEEETDVTGVGVNSADQVNLPSTPGTYLVSNNWKRASGSGAWGIYSSGATVVGAAGTYCNGTVTGGTFKVKLTATNSIASGDVWMLPNSGTFGSAPTSGTLSSGTATCSGTISITSSVLSGMATACIRTSSGTLLGCVWNPAVAYTSGDYIAFVAIGNGDEQVQSTTSYEQNLLVVWTGTVPLDIYSTW